MLTTLNSGIDVLLLLLISFSENLYPGQLYSNRSMFETFEINVFVVGGQLACPGQALFSAFMTALFIHSSPFVSIFTWRETIVPPSIQTPVCHKWNKPQRSTFFCEPKRDVTCIMYKFICLCNCSFVLFTSVKHK